MACTTNQLHVTKIKSNIHHFTLLYRERKRPTTFSPFRFVALKSQSWSNKMMRRLTKATVLLIKPFCASYAFYRVNIQLAQEVLAVKATLRNISLYYIRAW